MRALLIVGSLVAATLIPWDSLTLPGAGPPSGRSDTQAGSAPGIRPLAARLSPALGIIFQSKVRGSQFPQPLTCLLPGQVFTRQGGPCCGGQGGFREVIGIRLWSTLRGGRGLAGRDRADSVLTHDAWG